MDSNSLLCPFTLQQVNLGPPESIFDQRPTDNTWLTWASCKAWLRGQGQTNRTVCHSYRGWGFHLKNKHSQKPNIKTNSLPQNYDFPLHNYQNQIKSTKEARGNQLGIEEWTRKAECRKGNVIKLIIVQWSNHKAYKVLTKNNIIYHNKSHNKHKRQHKTNKQNKQTTKHTTNDYMQAYLSIRKQTQDQRHKISIHR